jgi:hypothetical protein
MRNAWNKNRLAYSPLGPYVVQQYENGLSYGKIAKEVGIYKGCVQRICSVMGVTPRENHTTGNPEIWEKRLSDYLGRTGVSLIHRPERLTKKSRILTECEHGIFERPCQVLENLQHCCKPCSKLGSNNPGKGWGVRTEYRSLQGVLYLIRYLDESGIHFKIGITKRSLNRRFKNHQLISIIHLRHATLGECFDLEQSLLKWAKDNGHRYSSPTTTELIHPDGLPYLLDRLTALTSVA